MQLIAFATCNPFQILAQHYSKQSKSLLNVNFFTSYCAVPVTYFIPTVKCHLLEQHFTPIGSVVVSVASLKGVVTNNDLSSGAGQTRYFLELSPYDSMNLSKSQRVSCQSKPVYIIAN